MSAEVTAAHSRLMKTGLLVEESRSWWQNRDHIVPIGDLYTLAFDGFWFGMRSEKRVRSLVKIMRDRFDRYPSALAVLHRWRDASPDERALVCHWHLQLTDPIYRAFCGSLLERNRHRGEIRQQRVVDWVEAEHPERWTLASRRRIASALLSCAHYAGLIATTRDPRPIQVPRVSDKALGYVLYLLKGIDFEGSIFDNPYLSSVGLSGDVLDARLRNLPGLTYERMGHLVDVRWHHDTLTQWAEAAR
jgi:hypothetical protein